MQNSARTTLALAIAFTFGALGPLADAALAKTPGARASARQPGSKAQPTHGLSQAEVDSRFLTLEEMLVHFRAIQDDLHLGRMRDLAEQNPKKGVSMAAREAILSHAQAIKSDRKNPARKMRALRYILFFSAVQSKSHGPAAVKVVGPSETVPKDSPYRGMLGSGDSLGTVVQFVNENGEVWAESALLHRKDGAKETVIRDFDFGVTLHN